MRLYGMRRLVVTAMCLVLVSAFASYALAGTAITVHIVDHGNTGIEYYKNTVIPRFQEEYRDIEVEAQFGSWSELLDQYLIWYASGIGPDAGQIGGTHLGFMVDNDLIRSIDDRVEEWDQFSNYPPPAVEDSIYNGHYYTIPYRIDQRTLIYRKDLFNEVGLDPEKPPTTWDELAQFATRLTVTDPDGKITRSGFAVWPHWQTFSSFLFQAGGSYMNEDGSRVIFNNASGVEALQFMVDLVQEYGVHPVNDWDGTVVSNGAMEYLNDKRLYAVLDPNPVIPEDSLGVALPPKHAEQTSLILINKWFISKNTRNPDATWKWLEFVSRPDTMSGISQACKTLAPRLDVATLPPWNDDFRWMTFYDAAMIATTIQGRNNPHFNRIVGGIQSLLSPAIAMEQPASVLLDNAAREINALLEQ